MMNESDFNGGVELRNDRICIEDIDGHSHHVHVEPEASLNTTNDDNTNRIHHLLHHLHNYHELTRRRTELLVYMGLTVIYFGVAATLLGANFNDQEFIEANYYLPFHYAEFWSAFLFTLVEAFILISAGVFTFKTSIEGVFMLIVGLNVASSLVAALLFTFAPFIFERPAHFIEYGSQITVTLANFIFILHHRPSSKVSLIIQLSIASIMVVVSILKIIFYTDTITVEMGPERASHFFEFTGEMANSAWAFVFAFSQFARLTKLQEAHNQKLKDE
jgi:hypothetical protein